MCRYRKRCGTLCGASLPTCPCSAARRSRACSRQTGLHTRTARTGGREHRWHPGRCRCCAPSARRGPELRPARLLPRFCTALGAPSPACILMHTTLVASRSGVLEGIDEAFDGERSSLCTAGARRMTATSAATGRHGGLTAVSEGFVLVGFASKKRVFGSFVSGYTPTNTHGVVTAARGRRSSRQSTRQPAAAVYNEWTYGSIQGADGRRYRSRVTSLAPARSRRRQSGCRVPLPCRTRTRYCLAAR